MLLGQRFDRLRTHQYIQSRRAISNFQIHAFLTWRKSLCILSWTIYPIRNLTADSLSISLQKHGILTYKYRTHAFHHQPTNRHTFPHFVRLRRQCHFADHRTKTLCIYFDRGKAVPHSHVFLHCLASATRYKLSHPSRPSVQ